MVFCWHQPSGRVFAKRITTKIHRSLRTITGEQCVLLICIQPVLNALSLYTTLVALSSPLDMVSCVHTKINIDPPFFYIYSIPKSRTELGMLQHFSRSRSDQLVFLDESAKTKKIYPRDSCAPCRLDAADTMVNLKYAQAMISSMYRIILQTIRDTRAIFSIAFSQTEFIVSFFPLIMPDMV
ncbi:hypothetical protein B0F90DRAFT_1724266 [Multifurca ochricompacta]|uniref:Uncharacterized protein n=1 Tax=Multifurca ochricompacta TaxID=376703 RepID=A0AAD4M3B4_9AGAM|nr:hypothetical protein B0F90DRAFT_1724266 [Multifurca ochricompacta]